MLEEQRPAARAVLGDTFVRPDNQATFAEGVTQHWMSCQFVPLKTGGSAIVKVAFNFSVVSFFWGEEKTSVAAQNEAPFQASEMDSPK